MRSLDTPSFLQLRKEVAANDNQRHHDCAEVGVYVFL